MAKTPSKDSLEVVVAELRGLHEAMSTSLEQLRTKALALLVGEIAMVTFIFSYEAAGSPSPFQSRIISLLIFFGIGTVCIILSFLAFLWVIAPIKWSRPPETRDFTDERMEKLFNNSAEPVLINLKNDYMRCIASCNEKLSTRARMFMFGIYMMLIGIVIMLVLKYGNGTIVL